MNELIFRGIILDEHGVCHAHLRRYNASRARALSNVSARVSASGTGIRQFQQLAYGRGKRLAAAARPAGERERALGDIEREP